jgi:hypothetical protein
MFAWPADWLFAMKNGMQLITADMCYMCSLLQLRCWVWTLLGWSMR